MNDHTAEIMREKLKNNRLSDENRLLRDENARLKESCDQWQEYARCVAAKLEQARAEQVKATEGRMG